MKTVTFLTFLTYASWFLVEQRATTTPLQRTRFWLVLFSSAMLFRRPLSRHRCFSAKSASGDRPYASLADSSQGLAWWCWMQAFVACGLSNPTCAFWSLSQLEFVSNSDYGKFSSPNPSHRCVVPVPNDYMHFGGVTDGVDEGAEVALLSRNIVIEGKMEDECPDANGNCDLYDMDTFGGHVRVGGTGLESWGQSV